MLFLPRSVKPTKYKYFDLSGVSPKGLNKAAAAHFHAFTPGKRREYIDWITEAKRDATR